MTSFLLMSAHAYINATHTYEIHNLSIETGTGVTNDFRIIPSDLQYAEFGNGCNSDKAESDHVAGASDFMENNCNLEGAGKEYLSKNLSHHSATSCYSTAPDFSKVNSFITKRDKVFKTRKTDKVFGGIKTNAKNLLEVWKNKIKSKKAPQHKPLEKEDKSKVDLNWGDSYFVNNGGVNLTEAMEVSDFEWTEDTDDLDEDFDYSTDERDPANATSRIVSPLIKIVTSSLATPVVITKFLTITQLVTLSGNIDDGVDTLQSNTQLETHSKNIGTMTLKNAANFPADISTVLHPSSAVDSFYPMQSDVIYSSILTLRFNDNEGTEVEAEYDKVFSVSATRKSLIHNVPETSPTTTPEATYSFTHTLNKSEGDGMNTTDYSMVGTTPQYKVLSCTDSGSKSTSKVQQELDPGELIEYEDGHFVLGRKSLKRITTIPPVDATTTYKTFATTTPKTSIATKLFSILPIRGTTIILHPTSFPKIGGSRRISVKTAYDSTIFTNEISIANETSSFYNYHLENTSKLNSSAHSENLCAIIIAKITSSAVINGSHVVPRGAINATKAYLVIAVNNSILKIINPRNMACEGSFQAYDIDYRITFIEPVFNSSNLVVTLAEKQGFPSIIKLWDLTRILNMEKLEASEYKFKFQTQVAVTENSRGNGAQSENSFPISCFKFNYDLTCLAVGYTNGKVLLIRGDLLRDRGSKQRVIYESVANDPITGIQFNEPEQILYVTTTSKVLTVSTTGRNHGKPLRVLSQKTGADLECTEIGSKSELIVGLPDSIRYYDPTTKLKTINFDVPKSRISRMHQFILMVSSTDNENSSRFQSRVIILDTRNNHISLNLLIPQSVIKFAFKMNNEIYLLSNDGVLYRIYEKPVNQQIELILQRELFSVAFSLAKQSKLPSETLLRIQRLHADYLFDEQKYDDSMDVYISCLELFKNGQVEIGKSDSEEDRDDYIMNVITKFKEAINTANMVRFLERLHAMYIATVDHITLLLCCLCKLKNLEKIDSFIDELDLSNEKLQELNFPLIINLFKECGFYKQVLRLLYKLNQPNLIVDIQLYDLNKPKLALNYMKSLKIDDLLLILIDQSKKLLDSSPIETTELLINVFTGKYQPVESRQAPSTTAPDGKLEEDENAGEGAIELTNYKAFLNYLTLRGNDDQDNGATEEAQQQSPLNKEPTYLPPKPNLIYSSFTNHPHEFVIFLEACIEAFDRYQGNLMDKKEVLITLLEMYLSLSSKTGEADWLDKAQSIIDQYGNLLDDDSLLLLSHLYKFKPGEIKAREDNGDEEGIFMTYKIEEDVEGCFNVLQKYGQTKPQFYKMMLEFIVSKREIYEKVNHDDIQAILQQIRKFKLLDPLELIDLLNGGGSSDNEFVTFGIVKEYLLEYFTTQEQEITNNEKLIEMYEHDSTKNSYKLSELTHPFVMQNNKCSACHMKLDFPMIHFKCKHSFHQKCLSSSLVANPISNGNNHFLDDVSDTHGPRCPICAQDMSDVNDVKQNQFKMKENVDFFVQSLHESTDTFKFISEYIGKGVMEDESVSFDE
ncbi:VPS11 [Candida margitis]|uniref:VPS11 n=1 Tax=Candida margitis TaxID=1775924 RepID=UPI00222756A7|nr:VPS11 [Candida margitis]KAI5970309.1 VPS11 [Candida margitis]